jgi:hypothetical protein
MTRPAAGGLVAALLVAGVVAAMIQDPRSAITVRDADGALLASIPLADGQGFALQYRNSLYGTLAEERFDVTERGHVRLVDLAADQLAVLEEYYAVTQPAVRAPRGSRRRWVAEPAQAVELAELTIAATDLGERTLLVAGHSPVPLWELVDADPTVVLQVEGAGS